MKNIILLIAVCLFATYAKSQNNNPKPLFVDWKNFEQKQEQISNISEVVIINFPKDSLQQLLDSTTIQLTKNNNNSTTISLKRFFDTLKIQKKQIDRMKNIDSLTVPVGQFEGDSKMNKDTIKSIVMNIKIRNNEQGKAIGLVEKVEDKGAEDELSEREKVLEKLKSIGISLGNPSFVFITKDMFNNLQAFGYVNQQRCMQNKYDKQLPGEYIWLYDMKNGDYYTLKKKIRKPIITDKIGKGCEDSIGCKDCCVGIEYYKWKRSMWYTPPVGSQFKIELMNYSAADSINLSFTYKDNFLEDEANFKSILETASKGTAKDTTKSKKDSLNKDFQNNHVFPAEPIARNLLALRNDLSYYNTNFTFNSATMQKHLQNLQYINNKVIDSFGISIDSLINKYKIDQKDDDDLNKLMKEIEGLYNRVHNFQTHSFLAQKLKNYDYLEMTFKDKKGNEINTEEMRLFGGFKIDFSSGVLLTGLKDDNYVFIDSTVKYRRTGDTSTSTSTLVDTTGKIAIKENSGKSKIGFGVLVHAYPRLSSNYNIALTAGLSVNTETELNVILGGSLLLGSTRRFVLSGGVIWGKVNKLSNTVKIGVNRSDPSSPTSSPIFYNTSDNLVPTVSDTHHSWFFGLSYNFTAH